MTFAILALKPSGTPDSANAQTTPPARREARSAQAAATPESSALPHLPPDAVTRPTLDRPDRNLAFAAPASSCELADNSGQPQPRITDGA